MKLCFRADLLEVVNLLQWPRQLKELFLSVKLIKCHKLFFCYNIYLVVSVRFHLCLFVFVCLTLCVYDV